MAAPFATEGFGIYTAGADLMATGSTGVNSIAWNSAGTGIAPTFSAGTFSGTQYMTPGSGGNLAVLTTPLAACTIGMRVKSGTSTNIRFTDTSTIQFTVVLESSTTAGIVVVEGSSGTTLITTASNVFTPNVPFYLEVGYVVANTTGSVVLKVNGVQVGSATNVKTQQSANAQVNIFGFDLHVAMTDMYWSKVGFLGDIHCPTIFPNANDTVQWTPLSGSNFQNVDAKTQVATYNFSATMGQQDLFTTAGISGSPVILGASLKYQAWKDDSASRSIASQVNSSATTVSGGTVSLNSTATVYADFFANDPATSAPWTDAAFNAANWGYLEVS